MKIFTLIPGNRLLVILYAFLMAAFSIVVLTMSTPALAGDSNSSAIVTAGEGHPWKAVFDSAILLLKQGNYPAAETALKKTLDLAQGLGPRSIPIGRTLNSLGIVYQHLAKPVQAERYYQQALAIWESVPGADGLGLIQILNNLSRLYIENCHYGEAERMLHRARAVPLEGTDSSDFELAKTYEYLTLLSFTRRKYEDAEIYNHKVIEICLRTLGPRHLETAIAWNDRGTLEMAMGRYPEAIEHLTAALQTIEGTAHADPSALAKILTNLAWAYKQNHQPKQAVFFLQRAVQIAEISLHPGNICVAEALSLSRFVNVLRSLGRKAEAHRLQKRMEVILAAKTGKATMSHTVDVSDLRR